MIVARSPYRLSLFGGGTDYPDYFLGRGTLVICAAINRHCFVTLKELPPFFETHQTRVVWSRIELVKTNDEIQHPAVNACLDDFQIHSGVEIHHSGDLPARSGIGSSSAFTVSLCAALGLLTNVPHSRDELAKRAIRIEQERMGENVGIQDQIASTWGGVSAVHVNESGEFMREEVTLSVDYKRELEDSLMLGFIGDSRNSSEFSSLAVMGIKSGKDIAALDESRDIALKALHLLRKELPVAQLGELVDQTWQLKMQLSSNKSNLDGVAEVIDTAKGLGAWGGKLMGAGGSGFFYLLAPRDRHQQIRQRLPHVKTWVPVRLDLVGCTAHDLSKEW